MAVFHTEYNHTHHDWQCRSGIAIGVGATPQEAEAACLQDLGNGHYASHVGWLGTPDVIHPVVELEHNGREWTAYWHEAPWRYGAYGVGDTPEEAMTDLTWRSYTL